MAGKESKPNLNALNHVSLCHHEIYQPSVGSNKGILPAVSPSLTGLGSVSVSSNTSRGRRNRSAPGLLSKLKNRFNRSTHQQTSAAGENGKISFVSLAVTTSLLLAFTAIACFGMILLIG